jgi:mannose-6-phosphate isomerase
MIRLERKFVERVWGAMDLAPLFGPVAHRIGEVWFPADHPLLVKFIFTTENLSLQVHPDGPAGTGKTEMWHILNAHPSARLAIGLREPVTREHLREAALTGEIKRLLRWHRVQAGETYFVPAGTVHAIGAGITLCEIQQNSDITYRLYDYGRARELHLDKGLAVSELSPHPGASPRTPLDDGWIRLAGCKYFVTDLLEGGTATTCPRGRVLIGLEGRAMVDGQRVEAGEVWWIPPGDAPAPVRPEPGARLLRTYAP